MNPNRLEKICDLLALYGQQKTAESGLTRQDNTSEAAKSPVNFLQSTRQANSTTRRPASQTGGRK